MTAMKPRLRGHMNSVVWSLENTCFKKWKVKEKSTVTVYTRDLIFVFFFVFFFNFILFFKLYIIVLVSQGHTCEEERS